MDSMTLVKKAQAAYDSRGGRGLSKEEKAARIAKLLKSGGVDKVAAATVGPIIIRLAYEGVLRNLLVEDVVPAGVTREYDVLDDWGAAYSLHSMDGQVKIERFEGKRVLPDYYRIASEWSVKRSDLEFLNMSTIDYAEEQTTQRIMEKEDSDFFALTEAAIADWKIRNAAEALINPNEITETSEDGFTLTSFLEGSARVATQRLKGTRLVLNPADVYDIYKWDIKTVGLAFKEDYIAGNKKVSFGDYQIVESVLMPRGTAYLMPDPEYVGVLSVRYPLEATDSPLGVENFEIRKVYNELIAQMILNANGLTKIVKDEG